MKPDEQKRIAKQLAKNHACYVLITCEEPSEDGNMHVQMSYEGDLTLASYLIQGAQSFIDEQESGISGEENSKIDYLDRII